MEKSSAAKIVSQTFQNPFDKDAFVYFIKSLLNHIEPAPFVYRGNYIPAPYEPYIKTLERIGKYQDKDDKKIDLLIVHLKKEKSLERARTMQRNFIAWYLNGSRGDIMKDAALVAFVSPNSEDWRFSLVKMDYRFDASGEKIKVKQELTPARRFSFLVGKTESSHTAQSRLAPILQNDDRNPTLKDLEDAFSIERVTKEFFEKYRQLFHEVKEALDEVVKKDEKIKQDFKEKNIDTINFTKKLLGQIVFLYFLQKKGWFGVERSQDWGTGPKNFLRLLFEKRVVQYKNFFNEILEPLFYEALRHDRSSDDHYFSYFNCKIPFLNGGLFDPINDYDWSKTDILLPNKLFSNNEKTKQGDVGTGILDIFDRYNFTVKEDEPLEKEVAVDPEMLGKVFENLLEVKDRKSKGTYYTPREIVHYMCQQSLINYLKTETKIAEEKIERIIKQDVLLTKDEYLKWKKGGKKPKNKALVLWEEEWEVLDKALKNIKVVDPACGSGAFLVGMLQEVVRARKLLQIFNDQEKSIYTMKEEAIGSSIYGVDIDPGAIEIAKLRLWLSLVVDEQDIKRIKPLPNLDYKIVCGNSLLKVEQNLFNQSLFNELEKLKPLFFNETDPNKKKEYKEQIDKLIGEITNGHKDFDFEVYFSEVFHEKKGFDVVIANPPYLVLTAKDLAGFFWTKGNQNTYVAFLEIANKYINENGVISYIIPSTWLSGNNFKKLRKDLLAKKCIQQIIQLPYDIFEVAYVDNVILITTGKAIENDVAKTFQFNIRDYLREDSIVFREFSPKDWIDAPDSVIFLDEFLLKILDKYLNNPSVILGEIALIQRGTLPPKETEIINPKKISSKKGLIRWFSGQVYRYVMVMGRMQYIEYNKLRENKPFEVFQDPKILGRQLINRQFRLQFTFTKEKFAFKKNLYAIYRCSKKFNYLYLLAVLNSKFYSWVQVRLNTSGQRDDYPAFSLKDFRNFRVPDISFEKQKTFIEIVNKILAITKDEDYLQNEADQKKVKEYEQKIDQLVYKLYGLTEEEIRIIEKSNN